VSQASSCAANFGNPFIITLGTANLRCASADTLPDSTFPLAVLRSLRK
jgi:hypothetical protein